jgi:hypothetical protein
METRQGIILQSLRNVEAFLEEHPTALADVVRTGARQQLADTLADLAATANEQSGSVIASMVATRKQLALRHALLGDHMNPIARIAKARLPLTPEMQPLRMPKGRPTPPKLAADANAMAAAATPHADVFIAAGLPGEFAANLTGAAEAMMAAIDDRATSRGKRTGATKGIRTRLTAGRQVVHILDAFVKTALKNDPALLANWNVVKRVRRTNSRSATATGSVTVTTPAPVTPTAVVASTGVSSSTVPVTAATASHGAGEQIPTHASLVRDDS